MRRIVHLIPFDGIGGVERAARSMGLQIDKDLSFERQFIFSNAAAESYINLWNPFFFLRSYLKLVLDPPELLIVSLWRSYFVGVLVKLSRPRLKLVTFLHLPVNAHPLDRLLKILSARNSQEIWADSEQTLRLRLPNLPKVKGKVVSFVTERIPPLPSKPVGPHFVFWGRIHVQKGLDRALEIFSAVRSCRTDARFIIIGPDGGDLSRIMNLVKIRNLVDSVSFRDGMDFHSIRNIAESASFFLQPSKVEGMGMSVVEAMQCGLVPIVTPVGEIASYAIHDFNALILNDGAFILRDILALLEDTSRYDRIRNQAILTWESKPLYRDSISNSCINILN